MRYLKLVVLTGLFSTVCMAQSPSTPPSLDSQLRNQLALGDAFGCVQFLRLPANDADTVNAAIDGLRAGGQIGNELAAICSPSAVNSASSMGGALDTVQATKTVSQFRLIRKRIDNRLRQPSSTPPSTTPRTQPTTPTRRLLPLRQSGFELDYGTGTGAGVFGEFEHEWKDRTNSAYDLGYTSRINGFLGGVDYAWEGAVVGAWLGYSKTSGDFDPVTPTVAFPNGPVNQPANSFLGNSQTASAVCGDLDGGGEFDDGDIRIGGFAARALGSGGFVDVGVSLNRRKHNYSRNACVIEVPDTPLAFETGVRFRDANGNGLLDPNEINAANAPVNVLFVDANDNRKFDGTELQVDDIYAGAISGKAIAHESAISGRTGYDFQSGILTIGPRVVFTHTSTSVDPYTETGRSTVANDVHPNRPPPFTFKRQAGGPTGLELVYDEQHYRSELLQLGGQASFHVERTGVTLVPFASAYLRHEFGKEFISNTVRMAQDLRPSPETFSFSNIGPDRNNVELSGGMSLLFDNGLMLQGSLSSLLMDQYLSSTALTGSFRWRF